MRFQRLLMIIFYLQSHNTATINEISNYLEVSKRTVCRDIEILRTSGVEIESSVGKNGGYSLCRDFSIEKIIFDENDLSYMLLSTKFLKQFRDTEFAKEADSLHNKIEKLINKSNNSYLNKNKFLMIDTECGVRSNDTNSILKCVEEAYNNKLLLFIKYNSPFCKKLSTADFVAPYGLINKDGFWHVVGYCSVHKTYRIFNTLFIVDIHVTQASFEKDESFNINAFWELQKAR